MAIELAAVNKWFGEPRTHVLHDISLTITEGEFVSLTGRSGSGKSTLLYLVSTLDLPSGGTVRIDGHDVSVWDQRDMHDFRNLQVGFVFQFHHLLPELTALENVLMPARRKKREREAADHGKLLLREFGLGDKLDRFPRQLSGGEQQRVAIARALVMKPKYLFADEPTGNLDTENAGLIMGWLEKVNRELGTTVVMVTHDPGFASRARRQVELVDGRVVADRRYG